MSTIVHSVRLVDDGRIVEDGWVRFDGGRVAARGTGAGWRAEADAAAAAISPTLVSDDANTQETTIIDAVTTAGPGAILTPGFLDIHGHGGGGSAYDDGPDGIRTARALHRRHGTTRAVISLVTAPLDILAKRAGMVAEIMASDPDILGSHLEGPFLDAGHKGAHEETLLRAPEQGALELLLDAGRGTIRQITFAPELIGGLAAIRATVRAGAAAAIGHTGADYRECQAAFEAGATILTHAFNAMPGLHHRDPGPVAAAASDPRVTLELIADGVHVHPEMLRTAFAMAPGRVALVTDAMAAAGAADGEYRLGPRRVLVRDRVARLIAGAPEGEGAIAGSTLTQDAALRTAIAAGVDLADAVAALTTVPARAIGVSDQYGTLTANRVADAVLLTGDLEVRAVWSAGTLV